MIQFKTESGSIYEVDTESKRARRVSGEHEPTERQGRDGQWRRYLWVSPIKVGLPVFFTWDVEDIRYKGTLTSQAVDVQEIETTPAHADA